MEEIQAVLAAVSVVSAAVFPVAVGRREAGSR